MFESRVDAMLNPHERVAILLGLLEHSKWIMERKHVTSPNIHLLARKPDLCNKDTPHGSPKDYTPTRRQLTREAEFLFAESDDPEAVRVDQALARIMTDSDQMYAEHEKDRAAQQAN